MDAVKRGKALACVSTYEETVDDLCLDCGREFDRCCHHGFDFCTCCVGIRCETVCSSSLLPLSLPPLELAVLLRSLTALVC